MTTVELPVILLLASAGVLGTIAVFRTRNGRVEKSLYVTLRVLQALLLITAFSRPVITCNRLSSSENTTAILVDVSQSMSLFDIDSAVNRLDSLVLGNAASRSRNLHTFDWYLFGDSLRQWNRVYPLQTTDRRSLYPSARYSALFQQTSDCIIISDGAWSNSDAARVASDNQTIWYIPLSRDSSRPYLSCTFPDSLTSTAGGTVPLTVELNGCHNGKGVIICTIDGITVDSVHLSGGYFTETIHTSFASPGRGFHLVLSRCFFGDDSSTNVESPLLVYDMPRHFSYAVSTAVPSIDIRFLKCALSEDSLFIGNNKTADTTCDLLIIADTSLEIHPKQEALLLLGSMRSTRHRIIITDSGSFTAGMLYSANPFASLITSRLPPVRAQAAVTEHGIQPLFSAVNGNDTLPLIYECAIDHRPALICGISDFWKWDFLPLANTAGETDNFQFSRRLVAALHEMLIAHSTDTFLVYPQNAAVEGIDISLAALLPSGITLLPDTFKCRITDTTGSAVIDTQVTVPPYHSSRVAVTLPALPEGRYSLHSRRTADTTQHCTVPLRVHENVAEFSVRRQNDQLLDEIGQRFDMNDTGQVSQILTTSINSYLKQHTSQRQFPIRRGWLLQSLLIASLLLEWILRKVYNRD